MTVLHDPADSQYRQGNFFLSSTRIARQTFGVADLICVRNHLAIIGSEPHDRHEGLILLSNGEAWRGVAVMHALDAPECLAKHGLQLVEVEKYPTIAEGSRLQWNAFEHALLCSQARVLENFLHLLHKHCSERVVGNQKLSSLSSIRLRLGEVSQLLSLHFETLEASSDERTEINKNCIGYIERITDLLIKTAGARSMFSEGLVEAQFIFSLVNQIYLCEPHV